MRIISNTEKDFAWETWPWAMAIVLSALVLVPLAFGSIGLAEGEGTAAALIAVSVIAAVLFAFFVGRRRVTFDKTTGQISIEFKALLRNTLDVRDLDQMQGVLVYEETGESAPVVVDPESRPSFKGVRYRAAIIFEDGTEMNLNGTATKGSESHQIARALTKWIGDSERKHL